MVRSLRLYRRNSPSVCSLPLSGFRPVSSRLVVLWSDWSRVECCGGPVHSLDSVGRGSLQRKRTSFASHDDRAPRLLRLDTLVEALNRLGIAHLSRVRWDANVPPVEVTGDRQLVRIRFKTAALLGRFGQDFRSLVCAVALLAFKSCAAIRNRSSPFGLLMTPFCGIN
jgi:hypothetical protein